MKPSNTRCVLLLLVVVVTVIGSTSALGARIRFLNSMPQFGKATVKAIPPYATIFNSTAGGVMTSYVNFTSLFSVFVTEYKTNVTALSIPYFLDFTKFYTLYTYQKLPRYIANVLVEDQQTVSDPKKAALRSINLIQYNFDVDVFNISNNALLFSNVSYGEVTPYSLVPPGEYVVYWETTGAKKRSIQQFFPNISFDPFLYAGHTYTHWILPTGSFIVRDGSLDPLRKRTVATTSDERLVAGKEKDDVTEVSVSNLETDADSSKVMTKNEKSSDGVRGKRNQKVNAKRRVTNRRK